MRRVIWRKRGRLVIFRVCRHGQFTDKDYSMGDTMICWRCLWNRLRQEAR
jgi:hypothetical protein